MICNDSKQLGVRKRLELGRFISNDLAGMEDVVE